MVSETVFYTQSFESRVIYIISTHVYDRVLIIIRHYSFIRVLIINDHSIAKNTKSIIFVKNSR